MLDRMEGSGCRVGDRVKRLSHAKTRDANEPPIVQALRQVGADVQLLDHPCDLLVGYRSVNFLLEVKEELGPQGGKPSSERGQRAEEQEREQKAWRGKIQRVRNIREALDAIGCREREAAILH